MAEQTPIPQEPPIDSANFWCGGKSYCARGHALVWGDDYVRALKNDGHIDPSKSVDPAPSGCIYAHPPGDGKKCVARNFPLEARIYSSKKST